MTSQRLSVSQRSPRTTTKRNKFRKTIAANKPACWICNGEINYDAESHLDPLSFTIDHVVPLARGGEDALHNIAAAHR